VVNYLQRTIVTRYTGTGCTLTDSTVTLAKDYT